MVNITQNLTTVNYSKGGKTKKYIVIHYTGNKSDTSRGNANYFKNVKRGASAHYFVDETSIYQVVKDTDTAWAVGKNYGRNNLFGTVTNANSISIEMCSTNGKIADATYKNTVELTIYLMNKYGISASNVYRHWDVCSKVCPGWNGWGANGSNASIWNQFKKDIINGVATQITKSTPIDGEIKTGGVTQNGTNKLGKVSYQAHLRDIGWATWQCDGAMVGTTGQNRRIEAFRLIPVGETDVVVHIKDVGDKEFKNINKDTILGTTGQNKRIEAIKITGKDTPYIYRVHQKNIGWTDWTFNGSWAGTKGKGLQIEAIEIMAAKFLVNPHVQDYGWLGDKACQDVIGMTGKNLRLEAFKINPLNMNIEVKVHIQGTGWKDYGKITKDTIIGTVGEGKRIECLCFKGDFEYRVHIQNSGWTDWTKADGISTMGTVGEELRIEAIQFR